MKIWINAQLSPGIASWISTQFGVEANALRDLGLRDATDNQIFLRQILEKTLHQAMLLLATGESVIEIKDIEFS